MSAHPGGRCGCAECVVRLQRAEALVAERFTERGETQAEEWARLDRLIRRKARREAGE